MPSEARPLKREPEVSHNLLGQRLGRKGLETRERIIAAALLLLDGPVSDVPITLSSVAREASVGMTTLYLYFPDLGELVLAALVRVMDTAEAAFLSRLRSYWPDDQIEVNCLDFLTAHYAFWQRHSRILHMRNSFADASDLRFLEYRNKVSYPLISILVRQMDGNPADIGSPGFALATILLTSFERIATVVTNPNFHAALTHNISPEEEEARLTRLLEAEARLIALAIRDERSAAARNAPS